jgi:hypothetical protein
MAVTCKYSNQFVLELFKKEHNVESDSLVFCLMAPGFIFDPATHSTYADISASEISAGNGYTQKDKAVANASAALDAGVVVVSCDNPVWTASGGPIADLASCCVVNTSHLNETVMCCIEFGVTFSTADTKEFEIDCSNGIASATPNPAY